MKFQKIALKFSNFSFKFKGPRAKKALGLNLVFVVKA